MINSTCEARGPLDNTTTSLLEMVRGELDISVERLLEDIPDIQYQPKIWFCLWLSGLCFASLVFLMLPFTFNRRKLLGLKNWSLIPITLALVSFPSFSYA